MKIDDGAVTEIPSNFVLSTRKFELGFIIRCVGNVAPFCRRVIDLPFMQKKTYGDKQREAQQRKKLEELRPGTIANKPASPDSSEADAVDKNETVKETRKADKSVRRRA